MVERTAQEERLNWRLPLFVVLGASIALLSMMVYSPYGDLLYILVIGPLICLGLLLAAIIRKKPRQRLSILLALVAFLASSAALLKNEGTLRPSIRWQLWSHQYKAELLAQPTPAKSELKHVEWDGWGFVPSGNNVVYLVFDPTDHLRTRRRRVHRAGLMAFRAKSLWYAVLKGSGTPCASTRMRSGANVPTATVACAKLRRLLLRNRVPHEPSRRSSTV